jgi:hypothetical protein
VDWLAGFRYLDLEEGLLISESPRGTVIRNGVPTKVDRSSITDRFDTHNKFYGGQLGVRAKKWWGPLDLELQGKVALGATHQVVEISGFTSITALGVTSTAPGALLTGPGNLGHHNRDKFAVAPEASVNVGYNFHPNWRVVAGYNLIYWSNVVRPGDQIDRVVNPTTAPALITGVTPPVTQVGAVRPIFAFNDTDLWIHGFNAGLEFHW